MIRSAAALAGRAAGADHLDLQPQRRHLRLAGVPQRGWLPRAENIEVYGSHCGLGHHPAAVYAIADRLAQPEGQWKKFDRRGLARLGFSGLAAGRLS